MHANKWVDNMPIIPGLLGAASSVKVAYAAIGTMVANIGYSGLLVFGQVTGGDVTSSAETLIPAAALTGTSAALVWVVKQIVGGNLVHRDPATATAKLADALTEVSKLAGKAMEREKILTDLLIADRKDHHQ